AVGQLHIKSLPTRGRGLKRQFLLPPQIGLLSLPTRGRGLKLKDELDYLATVNVAPHAGAWIETAAYGCQTGLRLVAPHAGAWIETLRSGSKTVNSSRSPR